MKIPNRLKIGGMDFEVEKISQVDMSGALGEHCAAIQRIRITEDQGDDMQASALLHEIIEAVNYMYDIKLRHNQICMLESALFQVLKDNALQFGASREQRKNNDGKRK